MTTIFRHLSSEVHCRQVGRHGVIEVRNTGPLLQETYERLGPEVMAHIKHAPAAVIRFDTSLHMIINPPRGWAQQHYHPDSCPQAIVVPREHVLLWLQHAENLWQRFRVVRTVWPTSRLARAYQWADQVAVQRGFADEPTPSDLTPLS